MGLPVLPDQIRGGGVAGSPGMKSPQLIEVPERRLGTAAALISGDRLLEAHDRFRVQRASSGGGATPQLLDDMNRDIAKVERRHGDSGLH